MSCYCCICLDVPWDTELFFVMSACVHSMHESCLRTHVVFERKRLGGLEKGIQCPVCRQVMDADDLDFLSPARRELHFRVFLAPTEPGSRFRIYVEEVFDDPNDPLRMETLRPRVVREVEMGELRRATDEEWRRSHRAALVQADVDQSELDRIEMVF